MEWIDKSQDRSISASPSEQVVEGSFYFFALDSMAVAERGEEFCLFSYAAVQQCYAKCPQTALLFLSVLEGQDLSLCRPHGAEGIQTLKESKRLTGFR